MMKDEDTVQDAFYALQTGYGILGSCDYARLPASSLPAALLA